MICFWDLIFNFSPAVLVILLDPSLSQYSFRLRPSVRPPRHFFFSIHLLIGKKTDGHGRCFTVGYKIRTRNVLQLPLDLEPGDWKSSQAYIMLIPETLIRKKLYPRTRGDLFYRPVRPHSSIPTSDQLVSSVAHTTTTTTTTTTTQSTFFSAFSPPWLSSLPNRWDVTHSLTHSHCQPRLSSQAAQMNTYRTERTESYLAVLIAVLVDSTGRKLFFYFMFNLTIIVLLYVSPCCCGGRFVFH